MGKALFSLECLLHHIFIYATYDLKLTLLNVKEKRTAFVLLATEYALNYLFHLYPRTNESFILSHLCLSHL